MELRLVAVEAQVVRILLADASTDPRLDAEAPNEQPNRSLGHAWSVRSLMFLGTSVSLLARQHWPGVAVASE